MLKKKNIKKPSDYKTLRIRVPPELESDVKKMMNDVEHIKQKLNKVKAPDRKMWAGNHVLIDALKIGLENLSKQKI